MSCQKGRFDTCDTGGSCRSSWSLCTTSVKSSAWKQTTSLVIRGWSLLEKNENSRNFWVFELQSIPALPAESFIEPMTCLSATLCMKSQHFSIVYYFKKELLYIYFPFFFLIFAAFTTEGMFAWTIHWKAWDPGSNCHGQNSLWSRNHYLLNSSIP